MLKLARRQVSPQHMLFYGLGLWALVWITSPVEYYTHKEPAAVLLLVGYITAFFWGTLLLRKPVAPKDGVEEAWPRVPRNIKISFTILLLAGYLGLALRLFDLFFIKNYASFASAAAFRAGIGGADPATEDKGLISIVSAGLYPLAVVAFICAVFYKKHLYKWQFFFAALGLLPFMGYVVLIGARSPLFSAIIMCAVAWVASTGRQGISIRLSSPRFIKIAVVPLVIVVGFFFYSMSVFNQRIETFGFKRGDTIKVFEATRDARVKPAVRDEIFSTSPFSPALEAGTYLSFYYVHGVYYFQELYPHLQGR
jgi:oligosaccharide repeat unit polymerase